MAALSLVHDGFADLATAGLLPEEARAHWEAGVLALAQAAEHTRTGWPPSGSPPGAREPAGDRPLDPGPPSGAEWPAPRPPARHRVPA